jgi:hypothetical protein
VIKRETTRNAKVPRPQVRDMIDATARSALPAWQFHYDWLACAVAAVMEALTPGDRATAL